MMTTLNHQNLDLTLYMRSSLLKDSALDTFQRLLRQLAPTWASRLHLYRFRESYPSIDITVDGALQELALGKGLERGMLFEGWAGSCRNISRFHYDYHNFCLRWKC
jgi:hypothetical protein